MSIIKYTGDVNDTSVLTFYNFLNANKNNTFLEGCTINYTEGDDETYRTVSIEKNSCRLTITQSKDVYQGKLIFTNGTITKTITGGEQGYHLRITPAILCTNGLIFMCRHDYLSAAPYTFYFALTIDSSNELSFILPNISALNVPITTNLLFICGDSETATALSITPIYNQQKTGLIPVVINTLAGNTSIPTFYTSMQSQLPGLGLQAGRMDSTDYITNGYCFIRD